MGNVTNPDLQKGKLRRREAKTTGTDTGHFRGQGPGRTPDLPPQRPLVSPQSVGDPDCAVRRGPDPAFSEAKAPRGAALFPRRWRGVGGPTRDERLPGPRPPSSVLPAHKG